MDINYSWICQLNTLQTHDQFVITSATKLLYLSYFQAIIATYVVLFPQQDICNKFCNLPVNNPELNSIWYVATWHFRHIT